MAQGMRVWIQVQHPSGLGNLSDDVPDLVAADATTALANEEKRAISVLLRLAHLQPRTNAFLSLGKNGCSPDRLSFSRVTKNDLFSSLMLFKGNSISSVTRSAW